MISESLNRIRCALVNALSRVTSSREFIPEVDGLRFVAIFTVLALHSTANLVIVRGNGATLAGDWSQHKSSIIAVIYGIGAVGVPIFFVISGFILSLAFARHYIQGAPAPPLGRYFLRRISRLEPPYVLALSVMYWLRLSWSQATLGDYLAGLLYLHKFIFGTFNPVNIVTWSLEVEVCFYLLAPSMSKIFRIRSGAVRRLLLLALIGGSTYWIHQWLIPYGPPRLNYTIVSSITYFLAGLLLAELYVCGFVGRSGAWWQGLGWDVAAAGSGIAMVYGACRSWSLFTTAPFLIMILFAGGLKGWLWTAFLRSKPIGIIGGMCYSIYLWHILILYHIGMWGARLIPQRLTMGRASLLYIAIVVPIILLASAPLFYCIEKPFMNGPGSRFIERVIRGIVARARRQVPAAVS